MFRKEICKCYFRNDAVHEALRKSMQMFKKKISHNRNFNANEIKHPDRDEKESTLKSINVII